MLARNKEENLDESTNEGGKRTGNSKNMNNNRDRDSKNQQQKQASGVTKIVGRVAGRLFNNNQDERKKEDDNLEIDGNNQGTNKFLGKAFRGARDGNNDENDNVTQDGKGGDDTIETGQNNNADKKNNKNILDRFLESRRPKPTTEVEKKDPFETLLNFIDQNGKELDITRLGETIVKVEQSLILVKEKLAKYQRRTLSIEQMEVAEKETKRLIALRKELELRRKNLILDKTKLNRELIQRGVIVSDNNISQTKQETQQVSQETLSSKNSEVQKNEKRKEKKLDTVNTSTNSTTTNNSTSLISNTQNLVSNVLESILSKQKAKRGDWVVLCPKTLISPGEVVPVVVSGLDLLIIGSRDGKKVYCVANSCPHLGTPLETGMIERRPREDNRGNNNNENDTESTNKPKRTGNALLATDEKKSNNENSKNKSKQKNKTNRMFGADPKKSENVKTTKQQWPSAVSSSDDGCEECIVCPLHQTAFALESGEVRGEWCPYPPMLGKMMGTVRRESTLPTFLMKIRGKNIEVRLNSSLED